MRITLSALVLSIATVASFSFLACGGDATGTPTVPTASVPEGGAPAAPATGSATPAAPEAPKK